MFVDIVLFALTIKTLCQLIKLCTEFSISHRFLFNLTKSLVFLFNSGNTLGIEYIDALEESRKKENEKFYYPPTKLNEKVTLIDQILAHSCDRKGTYKYLIKWITSDNNKEIRTWEIPHPTLKTWIKQYN